MQALELTKDTVVQRAGKVDKAEKSLRAFQEHAQYLGEKVTEQPNQVAAKDAEAANEPERLSTLDIQVASLSADLQHTRAQNTIDKDLLEGFKTASALQKMAFQQCISSYIRKREKLVAKNAVIDTKFFAVQDRHEHGTWSVVGAIRRIDKSYKRRGVRS